MVPSQSALFTMRAGLCGSSKSRNLPSCARMPAAFVSICSRENPTRSCDLPLGSPIIPVPPPTMAIAACPARCSRANPKDGQQLAHVKAGRRRIEPDIAGDTPGRQRVPHAVGAVVQHLAPLQLIGRNRWVRTYTKELERPSCARLSDGLRYDQLSSARRTPAPRPFIVRLRSCDPG